MNYVTSSINTYNVIKEIIIPGLSVLSTMTIGIFIAIVLKRREENSKIKSLLIDSYLEYLNRRTKFVEFETYLYILHILKHCCPIKQKEKEACFWASFFYRKFGVPTLSINDGQKYTFFQ